MEEVFHDRSQAGSQVSPEGVEEGAQKGQEQLEGEAGGQRFVLQ